MSLKRCILEVAKGKKGNHDRLTIGHRLELCNFTITGALHCTMLIMDDISDSSADWQCKFALGSKL